MDISIVIVNYKSKGHTLNCIKSIKESDFANLKYEIIVVDNNSNDSIGEILNWQYPNIIFIQNNYNGGLGVGNNAGFKKAQGKYLVVMNPDTIVLEDVFGKLYTYMENNPRVGLVGPKQLNPDKTIQDSCFRFPGILTLICRRTFLGGFKFARKIINKYLMKDFNHKFEKEVDWLLGSFMFMRAEALREVGMFDEKFFLYFEDTDLCRRFWKKKWKVIYYPLAQIIHNHARESAQIKWYKFFLSTTGRYHFISWFKYLRKWGINN
jgi:GT2 family glycosyltransferase